MGSSTAEIIAGSFSFADSSFLNFSVTDTVTGEFFIRVVNTLNSNISGQSGLLNIVPSDLDYVVIRTAANNGGEAFGDTTVSANTTTTLFAAGYDVYTNYRSDVIVDWSGSGLTNPVSGNGTFYNFTPVIAPDAGRILAQSAVPGVSADSTGLITVITGNLAQLRIQTARGSNQGILTDTTITTDDSLIVYAAGYDIQGNYLGEFAANWSITNNIGQFITTDGQDSIIFDATTSCIWINSCNACRKSEYC